MNSNFFFCSIVMVIAVQLNMTETPPLMFIASNGLSAVERFEDPAYTVYLNSIAETNLFVLTGSPRKNFI
jgi:hypothetical protein